MAAADTSRNRGQLFVIAAPSGAGKTSLVKALLARKPRLRVSISHTTRARRATEEHGREYYFVPVDEFRERVKRGEFLEHAQVFDNYYGTGRAPVDEQLAQGRNVILEIDWQGARQVRAAMPEARTIFILPPSRRRRAITSSVSVLRLRRRSSRAWRDGGRMKMVRASGIAARTWRAPCQSISRMTFRPCASCSSTGARPVP